MKAELFIVMKAEFLISLNLNAICEEAEIGGYTGYISELPSIDTYGKTMEEVGKNLSNALNKILEANREEIDTTLRSEILRLLNKG